MRITQQEEDLFTEWRKKRPGFVADGVADEHKYQESSPKLRFILKEVNDPDGGDWDLRKYMREGGRSQTWNNIARWTEGIRNISSDLPWSDLNEIDESGKIKAISSITAMNLKKSPGGHTTDNTLLATIAVEDKEFLNRQFALYEPDIVICCGSSTNDTFHWLVDFLSKSPLGNLLVGAFGFMNSNRESLWFVMPTLKQESRIASSITGL